MKRSSEVKVNRANWSRQRDVNQIQDQQTSQK